MLTAMASLGLVCATIAGDPVTTAGKVDAVTVFRGEAIVTRLVDLPNVHDPVEVVVTDLPPTVVPESIYAESDLPIHIRSIRFRVRPVAEDIRDDVRAVDRQLHELQTNRELIEKRRAVLEEDRAYLKLLEGFTAPTANMELSRGVLQPDTIEKVTRFLAEERQRLAVNGHELEQENRELAEQIDVLNRQRQVLAASSSKNVLEAVVFVDGADAGGSFRLRYLVRGATWTPSYNFRTDSDQKGVLIEYNGSIQQTSGEDWSDVEMTLSTATPALTARGPELAAMSVRLEPHVKASSASEAAVNQVAPVEELRKEVRQAAAERAKSPVTYFYQNRPANPFSQDEASVIMPSLEVLDQKLNGTAGEMQIAEYNRGNALTPPGKPHSEEGISVTYTLPGRISMPSRSDQQLVQINSREVTANFAKVATPLLTEFVYNEATLVNAGETVLLAGPATSYVDGKFVGQGIIPTVAAGESFKVGFGIDSSLRARRETVRESEKGQGGNRVVDLGYRLVVENFGSKPAKLHLLDRIPIAKESDVKISLISSEDELSKDADYLATARKKGILRWDIDVPPSSSGTNAKSVTYEFRMEFDKNMQIGGETVQN